uniref:Uncharacterized protein n=1 Tax=Anopheles atroparvus TaxID=41427 RepID=A0A182J861_ANOAO
MKVFTSLRIASSGSGTPSQCDSSKFSPLRIRPNNLLNLFVHFLLNFRVTGQVIRGEANTGCGCVVPGKHERVHLLPDVIIRQGLSIHRDVQQKIQQGHTTLTIHVRFFDLFLSALLFSFIFQLLLAFADDPVGETVNHFQQPLLATISFREQERPLELASKREDSFQNDL